MENNVNVTEDGKRILKKLPFTGVRKAMAKNLINSWNQAVTVSGFVKVDASAVKNLKEKLAAKGNKVTYTDIFVKLLADAAKAHPIVNSSLVEKKIELYESVNVGVAVGTPEGMLLVPVIREAQDKTVLEVSAELKQLTEKIIKKTITAEELSGGTITMSSMGMFDTYGMSQVLVSPQVMILGFGRIRDEAVVLEDGSVGIRPMMYVSTSIDHRVVQGTPSAQFTTTLQEYFNSPEEHMGL